MFPPSSLLMPKFLKARLSPGPPAGWGRGDVAAAVLGGGLCGQPRLSAQVFPSQARPFCVLHGHLMNQAKPVLCDMPSVTPEVEKHQLNPAEN